MTIYAKITISGTTLEDVYSTSVTKSTNVNNSASNFVATVDNFTGVNAGSWTIGDEVIVYTDKDVNPPTTKIFTGILEDIDFKSKTQYDRLIFTGRDYTARLQDRTVEPEVYTSLPAGSIVKDIIAKYTDDITTTNVSDSPTTINRISFNHTPVFDAVMQLAEQADYTFYIDTDKDLHFKAKSTVSSGKTFSSGNIIDSDFKERRDTVFNEVWVYGDRYLDNFSETFTADGGSVFSLLYKPHNTDITASGVRQVGGVFGMATIPTSGTNYLVSYDDKQIVFTSGTTIGNSFPVSGVSVVTKYQRLLPIVKVGKDNSSISAYGKRVKRIVDKSIKDPAAATQIVSSTLNETSIPKKQGTIQVKGIVDVTPSQTCIVNIPWSNINSQTYDIIGAQYDLNKTSMLNEKVLTVKVNKKLDDITDKIKDLDSRLKKVEGADIDSSDILTRLEFTTGSLLITGSSWTVSTRSIAGLNLILDSPDFGLLDTNQLTSGTTRSFVLGHALAAVLGTSLLGKVSSSFIIQHSGGTF